MPADIRNEREPVYSNHYLLTSRGVQVGGEMSSFFGNVRDRNGNLVRTQSIDPYYMSVSYPHAPYDAVDARVAGNNQIVLVARFLTGVENPFANSMLYRAQEWSAVNPSRRVWTNTQGDIRVKATQEQIDHAIAVTVNAALDAAWEDFINTFTDEYLRMIEYGMILYFLTEDYEAAVANSQYEANTLSQNLPWAVKVEPPPEQIPLNIKFTVIQQMTQSRAAEGFANIYCRALQEAAVGTVRVGDTVCLTAKNAAAEQDIYNLVDAHNAKANPGFLAAITYDTYCEGVSKMCGSQVTYIPYEENYMGDDEDTGGRKDPMFY